MAKTPKQGKRNIFKNVEILKEDVENQTSKKHDILL